MSSNLTSLHLRIHGTLSTVSIDSVLLIFPLCHGIRHLGLTIEHKSSVQNNDVNVQYSTISLNDTDYPVLPKLIFFNLAVFLIYDIYSIAYMLRCMSNLNRFNFFLAGQMRGLLCYRGLFNGYVWEEILKRYTPCLSTFEFQISIQKNLSNLQLEYIVNSFQYFVRKYPNWNMVIGRWRLASEAPEMPQIGLCTDLTCDKEIKQSYECHCCLYLICFKHLLEHVDIEKRNKERLDSLSNELLTVMSTLNLIIEKKLLNIEYEKNLITQGNKLLHVEICSINEIENIFEKVNQAIASNYSQETIVKVESSSLDIKNCSYICKCNNEKNNQNDELLLKNIQSKSNSSVYLDLTEDSGEKDKSIAIQDDEYPMYVDHESIDDILLHQTIDSIKDEAEDDEQNGLNQAEIRSFSGQCPLTFDGAYGLTESKHSIRFCSNKKPRRIGLYPHFIQKHQLKSIYAQRLIKAIANNQDPITSKIFHENEDIINQSCKVSCPFKNGMINLSGYNMKNIRRTPCSYQPILINILKSHLKCYHNTSDDLARILVMRTKNNISSS